MTTDLIETSYRRFLATVLVVVVVVIGALWLWVAKAPMVYMDYEYPMWRAKMQIADSDQPRSLVILGDSRAVADLIPARLGPGVVNLAMGGATSIEAYYAARKIVVAPTPPRAVLISFSPANLMRIDNLAHVFWGRSAQFGYFSLGELNEIRRRSRGLNDETLFGPESPADLDAFLKSLFYTIKFPSYYVPALLDAGFENRSVENQKIFDLVLSDRGHGYFGQAKGATTPDAEVGLQSFAPQKIIDEYFNQTLALLNARNIPVYFVAMPHNVASTQLYSPDMNKGFDDYINSYVSRYPHFHILGDLFLSWPSDNFGDFAHLNPKGATLWSDQVAKLLNDSHVEGGPFGLN
jgi:hypothetical protein